MKIKSLLLASALLVSVAAFAQETNKDAAGNRIYGPYETNKFWDNWFITLGPGLNMGIDCNFESISSERKKDVEWGAGIGADISVGKWITPCSGVRVGWTGLKNGTPGTKFDQFPGNYNFNYIHGDFLWNISNQFAGYKEQRTINVVPYISTGFIMTTFTDVVNDPNLSYDYALGGGFMFPIRCSNVVSIVPDMRLIGILDGNRDGLTTNALGARRLAMFFNANVSVLVNLGKNNWTRKSTSMAGAAAALAAAEASRNALQALKDKSDADLLAANDKLALLAAENDDLKKLLAEANGSMFNLAETPFVAYFDINKATLTKKELAHLDYNIKNVLSKDKALKIVITGRADKGTGSMATNKRLSDARVKYVYDLLIKKYGLDPSRFEIGTKIVEGKDPLSRAVYVGQ